VARDGQLASSRRSSEPAAYLTFNEGTGIGSRLVLQSHTTLAYWAQPAGRPLVGPFALSLPGFPGSYVREIPCHVLDTTRSYNTLCGLVKLMTWKRLTDLRSEDGELSQSALSPFISRRQPASFSSHYPPYYFFTLNPQSLGLHAGSRRVSYHWQISTMPVTTPISSSLYVNGFVADRIFTSLTSAPRNTANRSVSTDCGFNEQHPVDFNNAALNADLRFFGSASSRPRIPPNRSDRQPLP